MAVTGEVAVPACPIRLLAGLALAGLLGCVHPVTRGAGVPPPVPTATPAPQGPPVSASPAAGAATHPATATSPPARATPSTASHAPTPKREPPAMARTTVAPAATAAPAPAAAPGPPPLDLASLEQRLRDTHAIGVFTKLSLKNQVDDLLAQFRAFYAGQDGLTLAGLRRSFELLLMKVATLLQDADPALATAVSSSREALWSILSDRNRFSNL